MEGQFDGNQKFKDKINEKTAEEMRLQPIGRDKHGLAYWYFVVSIRALFTHIYILLLFC